MLPIVTCPEKLPAAVGVNCTFRTAVCPGFNVTGAVSPESLNPEPVTVTELIVTGELPDALSVIDCSAGEFNRTLPKGTFDAFAVSTAFPGPSCSVKLFVVPPAVAVTVAVWLVLTAFTLAVKLALIAPGATVTLAGTTTEELLLASETVNPALVAVP